MGSAGPLAALLKGAGRPIISADPLKGEKSPSEGPNELFGLRNKGEKAIMKMPTSTAAVSGKKRRPMRLQTRQTLLAYLFMAPALILLVVFVFAPILGSLPLMFFDYSVLGTTKFVGLKNFVTAFHDRNFQAAIVNTILFVVVVPVIQILSIMLAVLVNRKLRGITVFRTLYYIPVVTSMVAISIMWGFLFDPSGLINSLLKKWGLISSSLGFLTDSRTAMLCIMFITVWQGLGYYMMMYLAGLQSIPQEIVEAAYVDGATPAKAFWHIKLPMLKPYIWFCSLNSVISAVGVFDAVFVLTQGGPDTATMVIAYYSYYKAFNSFEFGYAATIGFVQALITGVISIVVFLYGRKGEEGGLA